MMQSVGGQGYYSPAQTAPSASAVNIQIFEPKAYSAPQTPPPSYISTPMYAYPQQSMYAPQQQMFGPQQFVNPYQQFVPQQPIYMPPQAFVQPQYPQSEYMQPQPAPQAPAAPQAQVPEQPMPAPVLEPQAQPQQPVEPAAQAPAAPIAPEAQTPAVDVVQPEQQAQQPVNIETLLANLQSTDNKTQEDAITQIAEYALGEPQQKTAVMTDPVMRNLASIASQDTSGLQGPTEAQTAALNKAASGAQLTPEEEALTKEASPKTLADKNRVISMFTLAMLQKNQRDEIDAYNQANPSAQLPQMKLNDLIGFNEIENAARNDADKEVKLAAIQALAYAARPEDKEVLEPIMTAALQDSEPVIQQVAGEILTNMGSTQAPAQAQAAEAPAGQAEATSEQPDVSKMSRKEKREYKKAQKQAEKEAKAQAKQAEKTGQVAA